METYPYHPIKPRSYVIWPLPAFLFKKYPDALEAPVEINVLKLMVKIMIQSNGCKGISLNVWFVINNDKMFFFPEKSTP